MKKHLLLLFLSLSLTGISSPLEIPGNQPAEPSCLYHADIYFGKFHLLGYLTITYTVNTHSHDDHGPDACPVDSSFLGTYYRVVCANKGGNMFFDLIFRSEAVQVVYWGPALSNPDVRQNIEDQIKKLISALSDNHPLPLHSFANDDLDLRMKFTLIPDSGTH